MKHYYLLVLMVLIWACGSKQQSDQLTSESKKPNVLLLISDDQSYPHASAYGSDWIQTPGFDRIASEGILFNNCYSASPSCSPSRAALLSGRNIWELEEAGTHISTFPAHITTFVDVMIEHGYHTGFTGKGWAPGKWKKGGRTYQPAGKEGYYKYDTVPPANKMSDVNYYKNFIDFVEQRKEGQPFYFWCGFSEPHRGYEWKSGITKGGIDTSKIDVPPFLLDDSTTRIDLADYAFEIEYFDSHIQKILAYLEKIGELDNTLIIATSDNGMPFPRAKINLYEYGVHMPMAVRWGSELKAAKPTNAFIGFNDFAPTILEASGLAIPEEMSGKSFLPLLKNSDLPGPEYAVFGKERHNYAREDNMGYPIRGIRNDEFLYLRNFRPDRWPSGDPPRYKDGELSKPSGDAIMEAKDENPYAAKLFHLTVDKRPVEELYLVTTDPGCLNNVADEPQYQAVKAMLRQKLDSVLTAQNDPRMRDSDIFDSYPQFGPIRMKDDEGNGYFPGFSELGEYNPKFQKEKQ